MKLNDISDETADLLIENKESIFNIENIEKSDGEDDIVI